MLSHQVIIVTTLLSTICHEFVSADYQQDQFTNYVDPATIDADSYAPIGPAGDNGLLKLLVIAL